jgi:hypothetical protein
VRPVVVDRLLGAFARLPDASDDVLTPVTEPPALPKWRVVTDIGFVDIYASEDDWARLAIHWVLELCSWR